VSEIILGDIHIGPILRAQHFLISAIQNAPSELEKAGAIQAFEFCYELAWKLMRRILAYRGIEVNSPREVFRAAAKEKMIDDLDHWFEFIKKRNLTIHTHTLFLHLVHALKEQLRNILI